MLLDLAAAFFTISRSDAQLVPYYSMSMEDPFLLSTRDLKAYVDAAAPSSPLQRDITQILSILLPGRVWTAIGTTVRSAAEGAVRHHLIETGHEQPVNDYRSLGALLDKARPSLRREALEAAAIIVSVGNFLSHNQVAGVLEPEHVKSEEAFARIGVMALDRLVRAIYPSSEAAATEPGEPEDEPPEEGSSPDSEGNGAGFVTASELGRTMAFELGDGATRKLRQELDLKGGGGISGRMVNTLLGGLGLQELVEGRWELTVEGKKLARAVRSERAGMEVRFHRWDPKVQVSLLSAAQERIGLARPGNGGSPQVGDEPPHEGWLTATALGEGLRAELGPAACDELRAVRNKGVRDGRAPSAVLVNDMLEELGYLQRLPSGIALTGMGEHVAQIRRAHRNQDALAIQWAPGILQALVKFAKRAIGRERLEAAARESNPDYLELGEMTGRRVLQLDLEELVAVARGCGSDQVRRELDESGGKLLKNVYKDWADPEFIGRMTARQALDCRAEQAIAQTLDRSAHWVRRRLEDARGNTHVRRVFDA